MEQITSFLGAFGLGYILPFLFVLTVVVFFHELGHFWIARLCGVLVETFSVGFGRALYSRVDKHGTVWKIGWLPLGGYVKFLGDENAASAPDNQKLVGLSETQRANTLFFKPLWQRMAVVAAGPFANFILAILIFAALYGILGQRVIPPQIDSVVENSAAAKAGLLAGDVITHIEGNRISSFNDVRRIVLINPDTPLMVDIKRADGLKSLIVTPKRVLETDRFGNEYHVGQLGVRAVAGEDSVLLVEYGALDALGKGVEETWFIIEQTFAVLGRIIMGRESAETLGGPIRIAQLSGQTASLGFVALINLTAVLSVSIGLVNLFPIPMLDGGHLLFYFYEAIRGRPLSPRAQDILMRIGLALILALFLFVTWNDISRLGIFGRIGELFG